jgi:hypothetical protein
MRHHGGVPEKGVSEKSGLRRQSAAFLLFVNQLPRWVPLVLLPILLVVGLSVPGVGGAVALALLAFVVWFLFMGSPARSAAHRLLRLAVPVVILALAVMKVFA